MIRRHRLNRFMAGAYIAALVLGTTLLLGWVGPSIDAEPITPQEQATLDCRAAHGESVAVMLPDGSHRCLDKHGRRIKVATR